MGGCASRGFTLSVICGAIPALKVGIELVAALVFVDDAKAADDAFDLPGEVFGPLHFDFDPVAVVSRLQSQSRVSADALGKVLDADQRQGRIDLELCLLIHGWVALAGVAAEQIVTTRRACSAVIHEM
jgi:hypothetical protein